MKKGKKQQDWIKYYEDRDILNEVTDDPADLVLDKGLRQEILSGKRKRNLPPFCPALELKPSFFSPK